MDSALAQKLANTEYAIYADPLYTRRTRFGSFVSIPEFPTRWDANQLFDARCASDQADALLAELETLYDVGLAFRKLAFHSTCTVQNLLPTLLNSGWDCRRHWMMTLDASSEPRLETLSNSPLSIRSVPFDDVALGHVYDDPEELRYRQSQDYRLGGEALIAEMDGVAVGAAGWFVVDGIARFRLLHAIASHRRQGVASALIQYVIERTRVPEIETLCIHCPEGGPSRLYQSLGFRTKGELWYCVLHG